MPKRSPFAFSRRPAGVRLRDALRRQVDVAPAGEEIVQVPFALSVADEDEQAVHETVSFKGDQKWIARRCRSFAEPEHVGHRVQAGLLAAGPERRLDRAAGEDGAVGGLVGRARSPRPRRRGGRCARRPPSRRGAWRSRCRRGLRAPVWPSRRAHRVVREVDAAPLRRRRPRRSAVPEGASTLCDGASRGSRCRNPHRAPSPPGAPATARRLTPRLILPDLTMRGPRRGGLDARFVRRRNPGRADDVDDAGLGGKVGEGEASPPAW